MTSPKQKPKVVSPIQLADLIDRDRRLLDNYLLQGTHSILPISRLNWSPQVRETNTSGNGGTHCTTSLSGRYGNPRQSSYAVGCTCGSR